jgi:hypothetical protein
MALSKYNLHAVLIRAVFELSRIVENAVTVTPQQKNKINAINARLAEVAKQLYEAQSKEMFSTIEDILPPLDD